jgi:hypothetical protein
MYGEGEGLGVAVAARAGPAGKLAVEGSPPFLRKFGEPTAGALPDPTLCVIDYCRGKDRVPRLSKRTSYAIPKRARTEVFASGTQLMPKRGAKLHSFPNPHPPRGTLKKTISSVQIKWWRQKSPPFCFDLTNRFRS